MATYAYRWADGTVSVCSARNKDEAAYLFDEVGPISRKLILRLKASILFTSKAHIDKDWILGNDGRLGEDIFREVRERCYPHYEKACGECELETDTYSEKDKKKLLAAFKRDVRVARARLKRTPETPDIVVFFPKGLPGQNN